VNVFTAPFGARIAGASNTIARKDNGTVWVWGSLPGTQLGIPVQQLTPVQVAGLSDIRAVAAGGNFANPFFYALHRDGTVFAWGSNPNGELGVASPLFRTIPQAIPGLTRVVAIAASEGTGFALREDGTVWSWGANDQGELGIGSNVFSQPTPQQIPGLASIVAISAFNSIAFAVRSDGALFGWGQGSNLVISGYVWPATGGIRRTATQITEINGVMSAFAGNTAAFTLMMTDRSLRAWGVDTNGVLGLGSVTITTGTPTESGATLKPWAAVRACMGHAVGWTSAGLPYAWGHNVNGQLGDPSIFPRTATANAVPGLGPVVEMACGYEDHSIAVKVNGEVWTWGHNNRGQLGDGTTTTRTSPVMVFNLAAP
jgi:alpha-tubulin suppressor-like RCC1 family protein